MPDSADPPVTLKLLVNEVQLDVADAAVVPPIGAPDNCIGVEYPVSPLAVHLVPLR